MSEINVNKLRAKLTENGVTQATVAEKLGISRNSLGRKINGKTEFTISEVLGLCSFLHIDNPCEIFLPSLSQIRNDCKLATSSGQ